MVKCSSCKKEVTDDYTRFKCPSCGKTEVVRCFPCRETSIPYKCKECSFVGP